MIVYFPNGSIQVKDNICNCDQCFVGKLVKCKTEKGITKKLPILSDNEALDIFSSASSSSGSECSDSDDSDIDSEDESEEILQIVGDAVFDAVLEGCTVAIYSATGSKFGDELFYLCEVVEKVKSAEETFIDKNNQSRIVEKGSPYLKCRYLEKVKEKRGKVFYKRLKVEAVVLPYQIFLPSVEISEDLTIEATQYLDLLSMF